MIASASISRALSTIRSIAWRRESSSSCVYSADLAAPQRLERRADAADEAHAAHHQAVDDAEGLASPEPGISSAGRHRQPGRWWSPRPSPGNVISAAGARSSYPRAPMPPRSSRLRSRLLALLLIAVAALACRHAAAARRAPSLESTARPRRRRAPARRRHPRPPPAPRCPSTAASDHHGPASGSRPCRWRRARRSGRASTTADRHGRRHLMRPSRAARLPHPRPPGRVQGRPAVRAPGRDRDPRIPGRADPGGPGRRRRPVLSTGCTPTPTTA